MMNLLEKGRWYDVKTYNGTFLGRYEGFSNVTSTFMFKQMGGNIVFIKEDSIEVIHAA